MHTVIRLILPLTVGVFSLPLRKHQLAAVASERYFMEKVTKAKDFGVPWVSEWALIITIFSFSKSSRYSIWKAIFPKYTPPRTEPSALASHQCDQIWQKFTTSAKIHHFGKNLFGICFRFILYLAIFWTYFGIFGYWAKFHCCKWTNIKKNNLAIWSHYRSAKNKVPRPFVGLRQERGLG